MQAKPRERAAAREMRAAGATYSEIASALGVSQASVSLWVRDLPRPPGADERRRERVQAAVQKTRRRRFIERQNEALAHALEIGPLTDRELLLVGAALYWAEGAKSKPWRPNWRLAFINSDPVMIRLYARWLDLMGVPPAQRGYYVAIHESADVAAAERFWSEVVGVPAAEFLRPQLKRHNPRTVRKNTGADYHGCLVVRVVQSAPFYRRMEGIWLALASSCSAPVPPVADGPVGAPSLNSRLGARLWRHRKILSRVV